MAGNILSMKLFSYFSVIICALCSLLVSSINADHYEPNILGPEELTVGDEQEYRIDDDIHDPNNQYYWMTESVPQNEACDEFFVYEQYNEERSVQIADKGATEIKHN